MKAKHLPTSLSFKQYITEAYINLMATKLRTILAVLGILVGAASVVAMVSGGELASRQVLLQFKALGTNLLTVSINDAAGQGKQTNAQKLTMAQALKLQQRLPDISAVAPYSTLYQTIAFNGKKLNGAVVGATSLLKDIMKAQLQEGRFISFMDKYSAYCVIGHKIYQSILAETGRDPIGQQINLQGSFFTIAGVLKPWPQNAFLFVDLNTAVIIPLPMSLLMSKYAEINTIVVKLSNTDNIGNLKTAITHYINNVSPGKQLFFESPEQMLQQMHKQQQILTLFLGFIGAISLLVGGIGVMNIMLVSVTERKREIGIRMAIGARRRDIQWMFLIEAIMLSLFGGIVGVVLGILISYIIAVAKSWSFSLFWFPPAIGFCVSVLVGIFFGFYPAYKASKLDPIETLRSE